MVRDDFFFLFYLWVGGGGGGGGGGAAVVSRLDPQGTPRRRLLGGKGGKSAYVH